MAGEIFENTQFLGAKWDKKNSLQFKQAEIQDDVSKMPDSNKTQIEAEA